MIVRLSHQINRPIRNHLFLHFQADLVLVTDWLYRPADSLESHLAWTVLSSLDWAEGGLLSYDQHVTTAVTVVEADWPINQSTNQRPVTTRVAGHLGPPGYGLVTMTNIVR